jgi:hypothetical protein
VKVFFLWGSTCLGCIIFAFFCIAETKGLSLEQVDILYLNTTPVRSTGYRKELLARDVHASQEPELQKLPSRRDVEYQEKV